MSPVEQQRLPKIDFSSIEAARPGGESWESVRGQVMEALASQGCFEAVYPRVTPALRAALFDTAVKDLFALPLEAKQRNVSEKPFHGYVGHIPGLSVESLAVADAQLPERTQAFADLMWPVTRNHRFCDTVNLFAKQLVELEEMVRRMICESLGVDESHSHRHEEKRKSGTWYLLRFSEYEPPLTGEEKRLGYVAHRDTNTLGIVCQMNGVDGLEVQTREGEWVLVKPSPDSFMVIAGDSFRAWTNGRVCAPLHRIVVAGETTRYSSILFSIPVNEQLVQAPSQLVDDDHPPRFKPYYYDEFVHFCASEEGKKEDDKLEAYCGVAVVPKASA